MKKLGLYKKEQLCSTRAVEILFGPGGADFSHLVYPLRAVAMRDSRRKSDAPVAFLISVPKKRLRHAVDRVLMRRRIREAYRLGHQQYALPEGVRVDLAFVYVADRIKSYRSVEKAVHRILSAMADHYTTPSES